MKRWLQEHLEIKDKLILEFYDSPDTERREISWEKCSFQSKSQEDFTVSIDLEWFDCWHVYEQG